MMLIKAFQNWIFFLKINDSQSFFLAVRLKKEERYFVFLRKKILK